VEVYDRPAVILEIFHRHARTKEAQVQVECKAQVPRARERVSGAKERKGWGRGGRGVSDPFTRSSAGKVREPNQRAATEPQSVHPRPSSSAVVIAKFAQGPIVGYTQRRKVFTSCGRSTASGVFVADQLLRPWIPPCERAAGDSTRISFPTRFWFHRNFPPPNLGWLPIPASTLDESVGRLPSDLHHSVMARGSGPLRSHIQFDKEVRKHWGGKTPVSFWILNKIDGVDILRKSIAEKRVPRGHCECPAEPKDIEALHSRLVSFFFDNLAQSGAPRSLTARKACSPTSVRTSTCSASRTRKKVFVSDKGEPPPLPP